MNMNDYQFAAMRTAKGMNNRYPMILNGVLGLSGECGECADIVKKFFFQGHDLDKKHLAEELGDVLWYVAVTAFSVGYDLDEIAHMNVNKLLERYPNGFEAERSVNRND